MKRKLLTLITLFACAAGAVQAQGTTKATPVQEWDFSTIGSTDFETLAQDGTNWTYDGNGYYKNVSAITTAAELSANGTTLQSTKGLLMYSKSEGNIRLREKMLQLNGASKNTNITIQNLTAGQYIIIEARTAKSTEARNIEFRSGATIIDENYTATADTHFVAAKATAATATFGGTSGMYYYSIKVYDAKSIEEVSVSSYGVATYSSSNALDFSNTGIDAYYVPSSGINGTTVTPTVVKDGIVPSETGIIIKNTSVAKVAAVPTVTTTASFDDNLLKPVISETTVSKAETGYYNYIFGITGTDESTIGFYEIGSTPATLPAGKAYLQVSSELSTTTGGAKYFTLSFDGDSDVTGISNVAVERAAEDGAYYTLSGVRVAQPTKGLYIHNGKKVVIK